MKTVSGLARWSAAQVSGTGLHLICTSGDDMRGRRGKFTFRIHPEPFSLPRRALLMASGMVASGWQMAYGQAGGDSELKVLQSTFPAANRVELPFEIRAAGDVRVVFGTLRSTTPISVISLLDPARHLVWKRSRAELGSVPRNRTPKPELGDAIVLPEIRNAAKGQWTLLLERGSADMTPGRLWLAWRVLPRFELMLTTSAPTVAAGQPFLVTVRPTDFGAPISGLQQIDLTVLDSQSRPVGHVPALENALSREGIKLTNEPGSYMGRVTLPARGAYRVQATAAFGVQGTSTRSAFIDVSATSPGANLRLAGVRVDAASGNCARNVVLRFEVNVTDVDTYLCEVLLREDTPRTFLSTGSAKLARGGGIVEVVVNGNKLQAAGFPAALANVRLIQLNGASPKVLADVSNVSLDGYGFSAASLCK